MIKLFNWHLLSHREKREIFRFISEDQNPPDGSLINMQMDLSPPHSINTCALISIYTCVCDRSSVPCSETTRLSGFLRNRLYVCTKV